ncbi:hypothetical protein AB6A40_000724 [Gnathostoma spinigerum]|uniref:Major facilitator superfamily (MFS) profile domain-containing protein n=1 Tax=Gnathostoma spinigerum TaxID=75299 RepID=A0ABD6E2M3_9BILA
MAKEKINLGDFQQLGRYVGFLCLTYEILIISQVSNLIYMIFGGAAAEVASCGDDSTFKEMANAKLKCAHLEEVQSATNCTPTLEGQFESAAYEFGYYCAGTKTMKNSISFQMIGIMFGAIVFGQLSDTFGRRKTLVFGTIGLIISGAASTFATGLISFTVARFFVMFFTGGKHSVSYVFMMENLPMKHRMWIVTVITYSPNYIVFAGLAYICGEWRLLSRVVAAITVIPLILLMFIYESPRWLIQKGRFDEARKALVGMGKWDGTGSDERCQKIDEMLEQEKARLHANEDSSGHAKKYYTYHLFSTPALASYTILFAYSLMITSIISYGLIFNMEKLSGSIFLNTILVGSLRYAINIVAAIVDIRCQKVGRRILHGIAMGFISASLGCVFVIFILGYQLTLQGFVRVTALAAAAMCSEIYILDAVSPSELFPTPIRNIGIGFIQTWNRIGNILSPQIFVLSEYWPPLSYLVMFLISLAEVIGFECIVPETKGKQLPDSMPGDKRMSIDAEANERTKILGNAEEMKEVKHDS